MKLFRVLVFGVVLLSLSSVSCKKSGVSCGSTGWALGIQDEITNLSNAAGAYSTNPTTENCQKYRQAYIDYIDALKGWEKCLNTSADRAEWQQQLDEAEQEAQNIQC